MCGLAGFSGVRPADPSKLRILLMDNESRGSHSTGVYGKRLMRKVGGAKEFIKDVNFNNIVSSNVVISHTRQATTGLRNKSNAHPFMFRMRDSDGLVVGTHNGTIINEYEMEQDIPGFKRGEVDSESIYKAMAHSGDKTIFRMCEGHMALAFIFDEKLHLYRRPSRPLFLGKAKEGYYYTSIKDSLNKIGIVDENIREVTPHNLIVFNKSSIEDIIPIEQPRLSFGDNDTMYSWEWQTKRDRPELFEKLTGKKQEVITVDRQVVTHPSGGRDNMGVTTTNKSNTNSESKIIHLHTSTGAHQNGAHRRNSMMTMHSPLTRRELHEVQRPLISGENILIPTDKISSFVGYSAWVNDEIKKVESKNLIRVVDNPFVDGYVKSWLSSLKKVCMSPMFSTVNYLSKEDGIKGFVDIDVRMYFKTPASSNLTELTVPHRHSLRIVAMVCDEDSMIEMEAGELYRNPCQVIAVQGYSRINISQSKLSKTRNRLKIKFGVYDIFNPGLVFTTTVDVERNSLMSINLVVPIAVENIFSEFIREGKIIDGFARVIIAGKGESNDRYFDVRDESLLWKNILLKDKNSYVVDSREEEINFYIAGARRKQELASLVKSGLDGVPFKKKHGPSMAERIEYWD